MDLAAIVLPPQLNAEECFAVLDDLAAMPADGTQVGVFGYPGAMKIPMGENYMALPEHFFGNLDVAGARCKHEPDRSSTYLMKCRTGRTGTAVAECGTGRPNPYGHRNRTSAVFLQPNVRSMGLFPASGLRPSSSSCKITNRLCAPDAIPARLTVDVETIT